MDLGPLTIQTLTGTDLLSVTGGALLIGTIVEAFARAQMWGPDARTRWTPLLSLAVGAVLLPAVSALTGAWSPSYVVVGLLAGAVSDTGSSVIAAVKGA